MAQVLILGGTAEAVELAARLAGDPRLSTVTSLAGLTAMPTAIGGRIRRGGFGGPDGLAAFLRDEGVTLLIDATHPFAGRIAAHAAEAARLAGVPRVKLVRPPFDRTDLDVREAGDFEAAAALLPAGARVFLAAGRRELAPFAARPDLWCLTRMIEPPPGNLALPAGELTVGRPAARWEDEAALLADHRIGWIVSKDSGGRAAAKIEAARRLGLPVILVRRPEQPDGDTASDADGVLAWVDARLAAGPQ